MTRNWRVRCAPVIAGACAPRRAEPAQHPPVPKNPHDRSLCALVADDDAQVRQDLVQALATVWQGLRVVEAGDGIDAWDAYLDQEPALCFLDVRMPGLTGIEVAQRVAERSRIVFLSLAADSALPALQSGGAMHLLKPFTSAAIGAAIAQAQQALAPGHRAGLPSLQQLLDQLAAQLRRRAPLEMIEALDGPHPKCLLVDDIVYVEAEMRGTRVVATTGEALLRIPLKQLAAQLDPDRFQQVSRFALVNQRQIASTRRIDARTMLMSLHQGGKTFAVARHFQPLFPPVGGERDCGR